MPATGVSSRPITNCCSVAASRCLVRGMTEVYFYHLQQQPLERALPLLLEKSLQRGWRAVVQAASEERVKVLDDALWTYADASFLPHGTAQDGDADQQPVYLTTGDDNPNNAAVRVFVERTDALAVLGMQPACAYQRALVLFDGRDSGELDQARGQWKALKAAGHTVTYWQQGDDGRWEKKA